MTDRSSEDGQFVLPVDYYLPTDDEVRAYVSQWDIRASAERISAHFDWLTDDTFASHEERLEDHIRRFEQAFLNAAVMMRTWERNRDRKEQYGDRYSANPETGQKRQRAPHNKPEYRNELARDLWSHMARVGRGKSRWAILYPEKKDDPNWRPMTREPLQMIAEVLRVWAKQNGFDPNKLSSQFRVEDQDGGPGDAYKPFDQLTDFKRLCVLVSKELWPLYDVEDWL